MFGMHESSFVKCWNRSSFVDTINLERAEVGQVNMLVSTMNEQVMLNIRNQLVCL